MNYESNQETEIDLGELINLLLNKWILIVSLTVIGILSAGGYAYFMLEDVYTAESSMLVYVTNADSSEYTNLLTGTTLVDTYTVIATSDTVLKKVIDDLKLDMSIKQLSSMITVSSVNDTLVIELSVTSTNPQEAHDIADYIVVATKDLASNFEGFEHVEELDPADTPTSPSGPNRLLYVIIGALIGCLASCGIVLAAEFLDKRVKTSQDIENYLGLKILVVIPRYEMEGENT